MQLLPLKDIRIDGGTHARVKLDNKLVKEYSEAMLNGDQFPAMGVVFDGLNYWLYDGFHRYHGAVKAGMDSFNVEVTNGTVEDAKWLSLATNHDHGFRRTKAVKQRAVKRVLEMKPDMSNKAIAQHCGVGHSFVDKMRKQLPTVGTSPQKETKREGLDGKVYKMPPPLPPMPPEKKKEVVTDALRYHRDE